MFKKNTNKSSNFSLFRSFLLLKCLFPPLVFATISSTVVHFLLSILRILKSFLFYIFFFLFGLGGCLHLLIFHFLTHPYLLMCVFVHLSLMSLRMRYIKSMTACFIRISVPVLYFSPQSTSSVRKQGTSGEVTAYHFEN